jgi:hypothetical protein
MQTKKQRFQVLDTYIISGKEHECLAGRPTASGSWSVCYDEKQAQQRVSELHAAGFTKARYEELPWGQAWFDDENWMG